MSCLSWNCRGVAFPWAIPTLSNIIRDKKPVFVFLIETICDVEKCDEIKKKLLVMMVFFQLVELVIVVVWLFFGVTVLRLSYLALQRTILI